MSIAQALRELMAAGMSGESLCAAVERIEAATPKDAQAERRREADRERKRAMRLRNSADSAESADLVSLGSDGSPKIISNPSFPPQPSNPLSAGAKPKSVAHRLPENWEPSPLSEAMQATVDRWQPGELESQLQRFRDHWAASATPTAKKHDWQAAWRTWIGRRNDDRPRNGISMGGHRQQPSGNPILDGIALALKRAGGEAAAH